MLTPLLTGDPKALGLVGDSITFAGSLLLAAEALWKKTERTAIATRKAVVEHFPGAEDRDGNPLDVSAVQEAWLDQAKLYQVEAGALGLAIGFAFLLLSRLAE